MSGESISRALGVSRAAVNAAVAALRREGYDIRSSTKTGYELSSGPDRLRGGELAARLGAARAANIVCLDTVGSTNEYLKGLAQSGAPEGTVVLANSQTAGKGRLGRSFYSPRDEGIYLSFLMRPNCPAESAAQLTAWVAVAVHRVLLRLCGVSAGIKWVNDIVLNGRKLCGILTEVSIEAESGHIQYVVVGLGLNVLQRGFSPELAQTATSLLMETGRRYSRCDLAAALTDELDRVNVSFPQGAEECLREYRGACVTLGREVCFLRNGVRHTGTAEDIDSDFGLRVCLSGGGRETLRSGEVSVRGMYGYI